MSGKDENTNADAPFAACGPQQGEQAGVNQSCALGGTAS
ncbi:MAG: hypothetical protein FD149_1217 [Rhodospirillaceae bacterium]|nr:MAG: hypothetical protein FD149_1217 [Rhodospirillaceae bacterium]